MGKKGSRKGQTKLSQDEILFEDSRTLIPGIGGDLDLPTAPASKLAQDDISMGYGSSSSMGFQSRRRENKIPTEPPYTAFIGNLHPDVTTDNILDLLKEIKVKTVRIPETGGRPKGFGYVELNTVDDLIACLAHNGEILFGNPIRMDIAEPQKPQQRAGYVLSGSMGSMRDRGEMGMNSPMHDQSVFERDWRNTDNALQKQNLVSRNDYPNRDSYANRDGYANRDSYMRQSKQSLIDYDKLESIRAPPTRSAPPVNDVPLRQAQPPSTPRVNPFGLAVARDEKEVLKMKASEGSHIQEPQPRNEFQPRGEFQPRSQPRVQPTGESQGSTTEPAREV